MKLLPRLGIDWFAQGLLRSLEMPHTPPQEQVHAQAQHKTQTQSQQQPTRPSGTDSHTPVSVAQAQVRALVQELALSRVQAKAQALQEWEEAEAKRSQAIAQAKTQAKTQAKAQAKAQARAATAATTAATTTTHMRLLLLARARNHSDSSDSEPETPSLPSSREWWVKTTKQPTNPSTQPSGGHSRRTNHPAPRRPATVAQQGQREQGPRLPTPCESDQVRHRRLRATHRLHLREESVEAAARSGRPPPAKPRHR